MFKKVISFKENNFFIIYKKIKTYIIYKMKRIRLKKKLKTKKINILFLVIILIFIGIILIFNFVNKKISTVIMDYATLEAQKLSSIIINKAVSKHITEQIEPEDLFSVTQDSNGEIKSIDFNSSTVNKFLTETTNSIQINLRNIEKGDIDALEFSDSILIDYNKENLKKGIIYEISSGLIFNNSLLSNIGPRIPVKISLLGDATGSVSSEVKNYGINNALIEVYVELAINEQVILPFYEDVIKVESKIPVAMKIVTGSVPDYYANGLNSATPALTIPYENSRKKGG